MGLHTKYRRMTYYCFLSRGSSKNKNFHLIIRCSYLNVWPTLLPTQKCVRRFRSSSINVFSSCQHTTETYVSRENPKKILLVTLIKVRCSKMMETSWYRRQCRRWKCKTGREGIFKTSAPSVCPSKGIGRWHESIIPIIKNTCSVIPINSLVSLGRIPYRAT